MIWGRWMVIEFTPDHTPDTKLDSFQKILPPVFKYSSVRLGSAEQWIEFWLAVAPKSSNARTLPTRILAHVTPTRTLHLTPPFGAGGVAVDQT